MPSPKIISETRYHRFNIGNPVSKDDLNAWWTQNIQRGVITAGFKGELGDEGEKNLRALRSGDWILAYASTKGYVGAARVLADNTYELHKEVPTGSKTNHKHERAVEWIYVIRDTTEAISTSEAKLHHPIRTRQVVAKVDRAVAERLVALLRERGEHLLAKMRRSGTIQTPTVGDDLRQVMPHFNQWRDIPNLRPPFLAINLTNRTADSRKTNEKMLIKGQTGHWHLPKTALEHGIEGQTIVLFYSQKGSSTIYRGTCSSKRKSGQTLSGRPRYTVTVLESWKAEGNADVAFSQFFDEFPKSSNPTVVWVQEADHRPSKSNEPGTSKIDAEATLQQAIQQSRQLSRKERQARLKVAPKIPKKLWVTTAVFRRNPDVIVEALERANGRCEACRKPAPFLRRSDGSPFLEVHHRRPLAEGGEDVLDNAIALCPNCHRNAHFG